MRLALLLLLAVTLAACGTSGPTFASATSCGSEDGAVNQGGRQCLLDAFAAQTRATFVSRMSTIEGDPIIRTYLVTGSGDVLIAHDARRDSWGSGTIEYLRCRRLVPVADWNRVSGANDQYSPDSVFVEDGCVEVAN